MVSHSTALVIVSMLGYSGCRVSMLGYSGCRVYDRATRLIDISAVPREEEPSLPNKP